MPSIEHEEVARVSCAEPQGEAVELSMQTLRVLLESASDIFYVAELDGTLTYLGGQFARYGFDPREAMRTSVFVYILEEDRERVRRDLERTATEGAEFPTQFRIRTAQGEVRWLEDQGRVIRDGEGLPVGLCGVLRDITLRKQAEAALVASERRMRQFADNSFDALLELDTAGRVTYASPALERITGRPLSSSIGKNLLSWFGPTQQEQGLKALARLLRGEAVEGDVVSVEHADGRQVQLEVNAVPLMQGEAIVGVQAIARDVTQREALQAQMLQMQKMEAVGTLASGVAHDFNNLLTGILGYANLIQNITAPGSEVFRGAEVIEQAALRAAQLTQQLLGFARQGKVQDRPVDLHVVAREVVALMERTIDRGVRLRLQLDASRSVVQGDPTQLEQVVLNLAINACDAMPAGGELCIATRVVEDAAVHALAEGKLAPERCVELRVSDHGHGIAPEHRSRIFEPFFTTKAPGAGSGLGLAMVYGIVRNHGGNITVESQVGAGATFRVWLPLADGVCTPETVDPPLEVCCGRVLLVDDEEVVCRTSAKMLETLGYEVQVVRSGEQALARLEAAPGGFDLVLLDLIMPGMGGRACLKLLRERWPELPVLLSTGHALGPGDQPLLGLTAVGHLHKPYVRAQLARAVGRLLEGIA